MKKAKYRPRVSDSLLRELMESTGAVLIEGAKWCGKTTSAEQIAKSTVYFNDPNEQRRIEAILRIAPRKLLTGPPPVLLDEWQLTPVMWDAVRFEVDQRDTSGQFILTGSAVPADMSQVHHSGTGRIARMLMRPMSLYESGESSGEISLASLFAGEHDIWAECGMELEMLAFLVARGGWPGAIDQSERAALRHAQNYYDAVVHTDISRADGIKRNVQRVAALMRAYARVVGSQAKLSTIAQDISVNEAIPLSLVSLSEYLEALRMIFVIEEAENWSPSLRSKVFLRAAKTRYFTDPSIAVAAFGAGPQELIDDLPTMGYLFENMAVRDLRIYADALDGKVYHYLDRNGREVDAIIRLRNGRYGLVEIKLGGDLQSVDEGAANLIKFASLVNTDRSPAPSFMMVLTGLGQFAYRREDGVCVVPLGALKP